MTTPEDRFEIPEGEQPLGDEVLSAAADEWDPNCGLTEQEWAELLAARDEDTERYLDEWELALFPPKGP